MDKANNSFKQGVIISAVLILIGLMVTAGCGNSNDTACNGTAIGGENLDARPKDLDTLFTTNNCVSCDLSNWHLVQLDLSGSDLSNADLTNTNLAYSNLSNANLTNTNLSGTNLTYTILADSNLTNANLTNANLTNTKLTGAKLTGATWVDGSKCGFSSNDGHCEPE